MAKTKSLVRYGISFDMNLVGGAKTADDFNRAAKSVEKSLNRAENSARQHELQLEALNRAYQEGRITSERYEQQMNSLMAKEQRRIDRIEREARAVSGLNRIEQELHHKRMARARMAGMAASGVSGLGGGGAAAGAARFLGGAATLSAAGQMAGGFVGLKLVKDSVFAYADLEAKVAGLKTLFGEDLGVELTNQFKELAKTTILTNNQLIENAKTWASYGLTTDKLTDRLRRLGTVAGGNSEKFRALTIAFAQVNAQGKLMGQEKNQLINAGFSLQAVADAAGISMNEFADAMKNGEITADHLNEALIKVTSEGGLFAGYLEKQAETINGKMTVLTSTWEEFLQALGESEKGPAGRFLDKMIDAAEMMTKVAKYYGINEIDTGVGTGTKSKQAGRQVSSTFLGAMGQEAQVETALSTKDFAGVLKWFAGGGFNEAYFQAGIDTAKFFGLIEKDLKGPMQTMLDAIEYDYETSLKRSGAYGPYADPKMRDIGRREQEAAEKERKEQLKKDRELFDNAMMNADLTLEMFEATLAKIKTPSIRNEMEGMRSFVPGAMRSDALFDVKLQEKANAERELEQKELMLKEEARLMAKMDQDKAIHDKELQRLDEQEKEVSKQLAIDKRIAAGPEQRDAMFTGGSVEEFMFLRRQTRENETARAVKEAEDRAAAQRDRIEQERKESMRSLEAKIEANTLAISELKPGEI